MKSPVRSLLQLEDLARGLSPVHRLHPLAKLLVTFAGLVAAVSFPRADFLALLPLFLYPVALTLLSDLPTGALLRRLAVVEPFVLLFAALNPLLDRVLVPLGPWLWARGWETFASIGLKSLLTVSIALLLVATTGMDAIASALRNLHVPRVLVLQLTMTYRYLAVLAAEVSRTTRAYALRAAGRRGIAPAAWGPLAGQVLLRTFDRAERVYQAMRLRGFDGDPHAGGPPRLFRSRDLAFILGWSAYFLLVRFVDLPGLLGRYFLEVIR
jgi:cobalt/nickel transport system permease protein